MVAWMVTRTYIHLNTCSVAEDRMPQVPWEEFCTSASLLGCIQSLTVSLGSLDQESQIQVLSGLVLQGTSGSVEGSLRVQMHLLGVFSPNAPLYQDTGCFGWHPFSFELEDSKEHHSLKCQGGATWYQPFDIVAQLCHPESSHSRARQLRLKKKKKSERKSDV